MFVVERLVEARVVEVLAAEAVVDVEAPPKLGSSFHVLVFVS